MDGGIKDNCRWYLIQKCLFELTGGSDYLEMSTKRIKGEELAGFVAVTGWLHLASDQNVASQQSNLCPHVHTVHLLSYVKVRWFTWRTHTNIHNFITLGVNVLLLQLASAM